MSVIACYSSKGGVGKTSSAVNLSYAAAHSGKRTLLVDLDQQGAASFYFRVRPTEKNKAKRVIEGKKTALRAIRETDYDNLHILPAHQSFRNFDALLDSMSRSKSRLKSLLQRLSEYYDLIILDSPPSLSRVAENLFQVSDTILIPLMPTTLSIRTYEQLNQFFEKSGYKRKRLRPFFSMVDRRKRMHLDVMEELRQSDTRLLQTTIPYSAAVEAMGTHRAPLLAYDPNNASSKAFYELWQEVATL